MAVKRGLRRVGRLPCRDDEAAAHLKADTLAGRRVAISARSARIDERRTTTKHEGSLPGIQVAGQLIGAAQLATSGDIRSVSAPDRRLEVETKGAIMWASMSIWLRRSMLLAMQLSLLASAVLAADPAPTDRTIVDKEPWLLTRDIEIVSRWPQANRLQEDRVTADLYRPRAGERLAAAVIISSSGGVSAQTEHYYARLLARHGMAGLVVDSFTARGARRTADDQSRVSQDKSNADAFAGYRWLVAQPWIDADRIIVLGMLRGGEAAYSAAVEVLRKRGGASDTKFAAHLAIAAGSCNFQLRDPRTTGAPIFFMMAELDEVLTVPSCIDLIQLMRAAGSSRIRIAVYPGVYHGYENTGGIVFAGGDWNSGGCAGRFLRDESYVLYDRVTGRRATTGEQGEFLVRTCLKRGYRDGGDDRVKAQASADLLQLLRDVGSSPTPANVHSMPRHG